MDKLKRVLSGNDDTPNDENRGIMGDVCDTFLFVTKIQILCSWLPLKEIHQQSIRLKAIRERGFGFH